MRAPPIALVSGLPGAQDTSGPALQLHQNETTVRYGLGEEGNVVFAQHLILLICGFKNLTAAW
jgi:hypothetical protein